ncbi:MAG: sodium:proton antiporter [Chloroherpetonaceae bacterium]|nr:sodium:proton antiporter [Chloroherpetonaceae bacterium]MDW8438584.1 sodium:proton antiporter [Chloroherpetonaceae bacterium]
MQLDLFSLLAIIAAISAIFSYVNVRFLKLPNTIGLMALALALSLVVIVLGKINPVALEFVTSLMNRVDFSEVVLEAMLSFLLFAGALHVDMNKLAEQKWVIFSLATVGVLISTFVLGTLFFYACLLFGYPVPYLYALLLGALISPTDPIAVLGILKEAKIPKSIEIAITGESLFNDGVGVVVFLSILEMARFGATEATVSDAAILFAKEVFGGIGLGLLFGWIVYNLMKSIDHYQTEVLMSVGLVMGIYALALALHFSAPLAVVACGLFIGNTGRNSAMSEQTLAYLDKFWELVDEFMNAVLFVLIGFEIVLLTFIGKYFWLGIVSIVMSLLARWVAVSLPLWALRSRTNLGSEAGWILTWGGLRGGISIALALSLPAEMNREAILSVTYIVVIFSILVQGLTLGKLVRRLNPATSAAP